MIEQQIHAIYENGVLRPLAPVDLAEHQGVRSSFTPRERGRRHPILPTTCRRSLMRGTQHHVGAGA